MRLGEGPLGVPVMFCFLFWMVIHRCVHFKKVTSLYTYYMCTGLNVYFTSIKMYIDIYKQARKGLWIQSRLLKLSSICQSSI